MIYSHLPTKSYDWKHRKGKTLSVCSLGSKLLELLTPLYRRSWNNLWYLCFCICVSDWYKLCLKHSLRANKLLLMSMLSFLCWAVVKLVELVKLVKLVPRSRSSKSAPARSTNCKAPPIPETLLKSFLLPFFRYVPHLKSFKLKVHLSSHGPPPSSDTPGPPVGRQEPRFESVRPSFGPTPPSPGTRGWMAL